MNVGGGARTSLNLLLETIRQITGTKLPAIHEPARAGDVRDSLAALDRAGDLLGYVPGTSLRQGLERILESVRPAGSRSEKP
jgi:nucleoside-diphosphate-sugar epimerase